MSRRRGRPAPGRLRDRRARQGRRRVPALRARCAASTARASTPTVFALAAGGYWAEPLRAARRRRCTSSPSRGSADVGRLRRLRRALRGVRAARAAHDPLVGQLVRPPGARSASASRSSSPPSATSSRGPRWQIARRARARPLDRPLPGELAARSSTTLVRPRRPAAREDARGAQRHRSRPAAAVRPRPARGARAPWASIPARRLVAQVGRLEPQKDYPTFLAAAARVAAALAGRRLPRRGRRARCAPSSRRSPRGSGSATACASSGCATTCRRCSAASTCSR